MHVGSYEGVGSNIDRVAVQQQTPKVHVGTTAHDDVVALQGRLFWSTPSGMEEAVWMESLRSLNSRAK